MPIDKKTTIKRLNHTIPIELAVLYFLQGIGKPYARASAIEDMRDRIDYKKSNNESVAFKLRESGDDVLCAIVDPYVDKNYMLSDLNGRDVQRFYDEYICLNKDGINLVICDGHLHHEIFWNLIEEYRAYIKSGGFKLKEHGDRFNSKKQPGCELACHRDAAKGQKKILAFIPIEHYEKQKAIIEKVVLPKSVWDVPRLGKVLDVIDDAEGAKRNAQIEAVARHIIGWLNAQS